MINKILKPKTKQELIKSLSQSNIKTIEVYEGKDLDLIPSKQSIKSKNKTVIILG